MPFFAGDDSPYAHILILRGYIVKPVHLPGGGRKSENPEETHVDMERTDRSPPHSNLSSESNQGPWSCEMLSTAVKCNFINLCFLVLSYPHAVRQKLRC